MKLAVTGASGFVGRNLLAALAGSGHDIRALVHTRRPDSAAGERLEYVPADVHDLPSLRKALAGVEVVYHLVGIIVETKKLTFERTVAEGTRNVVRAARDCGVKKIIYVSALGTSATSETKYFQTKWLAEEAIRTSGLDHVILRPSLIYGPGDQSLSRLHRLLKYSPLMPIVGDGRYRLQPIFIDDLVQVLVPALTETGASGRTIEMGGPEAFEFRQMTGIMKKVFNYRRLNIYIPFSLVRAVARVMETFLKPAPVTVDQLMMLRAGNTCDNSELLDIFKIELTSFEDGLRKCLR